MLFNYENDVAFVAFLEFFCCLHFVFCRNKVCRKVKESGDAAVNSKDRADNPLCHVKKRAH